MSTSQSAFVDTERMRTHALIRTPSLLANAMARQRQAARRTESARKQPCTADTFVTTMISPAHAAPSSQTSRAQEMHRSSSGLLRRLVKRATNSLATTVVAEDPVSVPKGVPNSSIWICRDKNRENNRRGPSALQVHGQSLLDGPASAVHALYRGGWQSRESVAWYKKHCRYLRELHRLALRRTMAWPSIAKLKAREFAVFLGNGSSGPLSPRANSLPSLGVASVPSTTLAEPAPLILFLPRPSTGWCASCARGFSSSGSAPLERERTWPLPAVGSRSALLADCQHPVISSILIGCDSTAEATVISGGPRQQCWRASGLLNA